jgi:hypothetical protein
MLQMAAIRGPVIDGEESASFSTDDSSNSVSPVTAFREQHGRRPGRTKEPVVILVIDQDRVDLDGLLRLLSPYLSGEHAWSVVHVPSVAAEDAWQLERELETVKQDRTRIVNRLRGLLAAQGIRVSVTAALPTWLTKVRISRPARSAGRLRGDGDAQTGGARAVPRRLSR